MATLLPEFAPVWEYLAWVRTVEGDSADAKDALDRYGRTASRTDAESQVINAVLTGGFYWRFAPPEAASRVTAQILAQPGVAGYRGLAAGASYMISFDAPAGAVAVGERFALWRERPELKVPGLVAQMMGLTALGLSDSALVVAARLRDAGAGPEYPLLAAELHGALLLFDSATAGDVRAAHGARPRRGTAPVHHVPGRGFRRAQRPGTGAAPDRAAARARLGGARRRPVLPRGAASVPRAVAGRCRPLAGSRARAAVAREHRLRRHTGDAGAGRGSGLGVRHAGALGPRAHPRAAGAPGRAHLPRIR